MVYRLAHESKEDHLMLYLALKTIHILAMVTWLGGLMLLAATLSGARAKKIPVPALTLRKLLFIRKWDLRVTAPAMVLTWLLGMSLAGMAHWFQSGWLQIKLPVAFLLAGLYGLQSGSLQRLIDGTSSRTTTLLRRSGLLTVVAAAIAICMAVFKPF
jgi:uncharacterized membrane protein